MQYFRVPAATYRVQFKPGFGFDAAEAVVPYLHRLGITDLYASPIFRARSGTAHGYDITDPSSLNPELGTPGEFEGLVRSLRRRGMGLLLDIVPNHMAACPENPWWVDVLENGRSSRYASYFDIHWDYAGDGRDEAGRIVLPVLRSRYRDALRRRQFILSFSRGSFMVEYRGLKLPLDPRSYEAILAHDLPAVRGKRRHASAWVHQLTSLACAFGQLPPHTAESPAEIEERCRRKELLKQELADLYCSNSRARDFINRNIDVFNGTRGDPDSFRHMEQLLARQPYLLEYWRVALNRLNYRRFFDISDLIGVRVEDPAVFQATHGLTLEAAGKQKVTGLRIDHVDGLYDPLGYLLRLQDRLPGRGPVHGSGGRFYVIVEKILSGDEELPDEWPVCGTTGYDFMNTLNGLFVDPEGLAALDGVYRRFVGSKSSLADVVYEQKKRIISDLFASELNYFVGKLYLLARRDRNASDIHRDRLRDVLRELTACCPVYRTYIRSFHVSDRDRQCLERAFHEVELRNPELDPSALKWMRRILMLDFPADLTEAEESEWLRFVMQWQQFTGPVMAKGFEDTALYLHNRLISLNEVGGEAEVNAPVAAFHCRNRRISERWPYTLNATSTHDTKRSEDVRARVDALSEIPGAWETELQRWSRLNAARKCTVNGVPVPDPNEELMLYQTLLGAWPLASEDVPAFKERLKAFAVKAVREGKLHSSWTAPNKAYERSLARFVDAVLDEGEANEFLQRFLDFQKSIAFYGMLNALSQVVLKIASPGIPDFYQGSELWDFSLVDPDNRRPVDFTARASGLELLERCGKNGAIGLVQSLLARWEDGLVKVYVVATALSFRRANAEIFRDGDYLPVYACGPKVDNVAAFARRRGRKWVLAVVPRMVARLVATGKLPLGAAVWGDDSLELPDGAPRRWLHLFTNERLEAEACNNLLPLSAVFKRFPVALLSGTASGVP